MLKPRAANNTLRGKPTRASHIEKQFYSRIEQFITSQYSNPNSKDSSLRKAKTQSNNSSLSRTKNAPLPKTKTHKAHQNLVSKQSKESVENKIANKNRLKNQLQKIQSLKQEMLGHKYHSESKQFKSLRMDESLPETNQVYIKLENSQIGLDSYLTPVQTKKWHPTTYSAKVECYVDKKQVTEPEEDTEQLLKEIAGLKEKKQGHMDEILKNIIQKGETLKQIEQQKASLGKIGKEVQCLQQENVSLGVQREQTEEKVQMLEKVLALKEEVYKQVKYGRLKISASSLENIMQRFLAHG